MKSTSQEKGYNLKSGKLSEQNPLPLYFPDSAMQHTHHSVPPTLAGVPNSARTTSRLIEFSTCDISDVLQLNLPHGGLMPDIHMFSPSDSESNVRICGPAYTVRMVPLSDTTAPTLSANFVDTIPEGSVIVIDAPQGECHPILGKGIYLFREHYYIILSHPHRIAPEDRIEKCSLGRP